MTLLELLRQELPKRGGWPEGAVCVVQSLIDGELYFYDRRYDGNGAMLNLRRRYKFCKASDIGRDDATGLLTPAITREQYGWDGTGLPPVGIDVEFTIGTYDIETDFDGILPAEGEIVEVVAHKTTSDGNDVAVVYWDDKGAGRSACFAPGRLRPLRTEAERAIDEMVRLSGVSIGAAKILYDAGYRK